MNTINDAMTITVNGVPVSVIKKDIKNLHLSVLPPDGKIRVTAPQKVTKDAIRLFVASRLPWIKKQQQKFIDQARQTFREYVSGESHYFLGKAYRLEVIRDIPSKVYRKGKKKLVLQVRHDLFAEKEKVMQEWYRHELQTLAETFRIKWEKKLKIRTRKIGIKRMKTKWGSCSQEKKTIWLNLELAKKPEATIEYVFVHELCHLFERKHNHHFAQLMEQYFPKWEKYKAELQNLPLAHEEWNY